AVFKAGDVRNGLSASLTTLAGSPRTIASNGWPSQIRGGATIISNRCWIMWTSKRKPPNASRGEASAMNSVAKPARNALSRQPIFAGHLQMQSQPSAQINGGANGQQQHRRNG